MRTYSVVAFRDGDPRAESNWLHDQGREFVADSQRRMIGKSPLPPFEHVEVLGMREQPPEELRPMLEARGLWFDPPEAYRDFARVYYLNDAAMRMYRDNGIELPVFETIDEDDVPSLHGSSLTAPYVFRDLANRSPDGAAEPPRARPIPQELLAMVQPPVAPTRIVGLPEHGLDLHVADDGETVTVESRCDPPIAAYRVVTITRWSDGREVRALSASISDRALRNEPRAMECAGASGSIGVRSRTFGFYHGPGESPPPTVTEVVHELDCVVFDDHTSVGPDSSGFYEELRTRYEAIRDLASELLTACERGVEPEAAIDGLRPILGDDDYRFNRVTPPESAERRYEYHRRCQALEFLNMRDVVGPDAVLARAERLVETMPRFRPREP